MTNHTKVFKHQTTTEQTFEFQYDSKRNYKAVHVKGDAPWDALPAEVQKTALEFLHQAHRFRRLDGYTEIWKVLVPTVVEYRFLYIPAGGYSWEPCVEVSKPGMYWHVYRKGEPGRDIPDEVVQAARDFLTDCEQRGHKTASQVYADMLSKKHVQAQEQVDKIVSDISRIVNDRALYEVGLVYWPYSLFNSTYNCRCVACPARDYLKDRSWTK